MSERIRSIEESREKVVRLGKCLSALFVVLLSVDCVAAIALAALGAAGLLGGAEDGGFLG